jgi:hypothetical protein
VEGEVFFWAKNNFRGQELMQIFTQKVNPIAFELLEDKKNPASSDVLYKSQKLIAELNKSFGSKYFVVNQK